MAKKKDVPTFQLGDYVKILHLNFPRARVVELRGPLGPGGAQIYRVRVGGKRGPIYIELRGDQLELIPAGNDPAAQSKASADGRK
jgi:hypothetical protein